MTVAYALAFLVLSPIGDVPNKYGFSFSFFLRKKYGFSVVLVFAFDICELQLHGLSLITNYK